MTSFEFTDIARHFFAEKAARKKAAKKKAARKELDEGLEAAGSCVKLVLGVGAVGILGGLLAGGPWSLAAIGVVAFIIVAAQRHAVRRDEQQINRGVAAYEAGDMDAVAAVHGYALGLLRERVKAHRARTLGSKSEWGRARAPLDDALTEAGGRVAYWEERRRSDPANEVAPLQLETARKLQAKLRSALDETDARADVLRQFYDRCEAKLAVMDRTNADLVEVKRLEALSGKARSAIAHAKGTIEALASQFLAEAQNIAAALGSADRTQLGVLAGDAPLDNIEYLADKIHENTERDRDALATLEKTLEG